MRFSYLETFCDITHLKPLAIAAEAAGYDGFALPESIMYPRDTDSTYPYLSSGDRSFINQPMLDPFVAATHMAAVTERLQFVTFVVKLAVRNPVLAAKSATSVAAVSGGRFKFGVGLSPWPEDFAVCGAPWEKRGERMHEMVEIVRGLGTGAFFEYHGRHFDIPPIKLNPVPATPMKILLGGHADVAIRRAVEIGDGWMHAGGDADRLEPLLDKLRAVRRETGRERDPSRSTSSPWTPSRRTACGGCRTRA
jgi:probable F420-dependent oxidoreductase